MTEEQAFHLARAHRGFLPRDVCLDLERTKKIGPPGSRLRAVAIDQAYARSEARYPYLFNQKRN